ncbi:M20/M25/M40 family metallo-hydrolase [Actinosynnema sp. NPDC047251]|uniref:Acetylornithine deacetylase/Succinyl-diaminopimelate desuccinylase-like protein n=1 Tax=Saccharothrix espanaensis (strain ATCC 51144 / DSM 44229 / JCM 9112 / NBRC 15066 / NRRL 15764) TaxID=1179773 RepID=K0K5W8_SACES|nr:M20/M25/M40 family metallo-hydrolase [Saccharothrix espanaensis]CCH33676.1 Acetylornithine deacetylase/Succinyl-diaminopimelate desuccinylase-like protein [Saccharothrix espanaensis DSM 44229]
MDLDEFLTLADGLLRIPSTADRPAELAKALDHVLGAVGPGFTVERFESGGKPSALVYRGATRPEFRVLFNAHLDVVPGAPELFEPRREGSRLHARGAQDMKLSALVLALVFRDVPTPFPVGLQLVTDEEVGGRDGTRHQLDQGVSTRFAVIGEHSALRLVTESKGLVNARIDAVGRAAHGAYPWLGDNALVKLVRALGAVLDAYPQATSEAWRTTVNVARVETSNTAVNQIPADASAWLDIRFPPEDADFARRDADEVARHLSDLCGLPVAVRSVEPPHRADPDSVDVAALRAAARAQGYSGDLLRKHGAADSRFFYQRGVDAVIFGVGGDGQHGPDEYADLDTVLPYYRALSAYLRSLPDA